MSAQYRARPSRVNTCRKPPRTQRMGDWAQYMPPPVGPWEQGPSLLVVVLFRKALELFEKDESPLRWDLETLPAGLTRHIVIDANEIVFGLLEQGPCPGIGARGNAGFLGSAKPADCVVVGAAAARALKPRWTLFGLLGKELALIHASSVHELAWYALVSADIVAEPRRP